MGIRVTEISTPFGGVAWEYTDKPETPAIPSLQPGRKIEVFISSICGDKGKYDHVRAELKKAIEETGVVCFKRLLNQSIGKSLKTYNLNNHERSASNEKKRENHSSLRAFEP